MNHVTRGMGKRSGMLVTAGLGRRVIFIAELLTQYISTGSRVWLAGTDRRWAAPAHRLWSTLAVTRRWVAPAATRLMTAYTTSRSWLVSKVRAWTGPSNRSHDADA